MKILASRAKSKKKFLNQNLFWVAISVLFVVISFHAIFSLAGSKKVAADELSQERILEYAVNGTISRDSTFEIIESITYDFDMGKKHGIYRDIPTTFSTSKGRTSILINNVYVNDEKGVKIPYSVSREGSDLRIKIGDPDAYVSGIHKYVISYKVSRAINYLSDHDEFYWNIIGTNWSVPIEKARANINYPPEISEDDSVQLACFVGSFGSKEECPIKKGKSSISFESGRQLMAGQGMTIVIGIPKGFLVKPSRFSTLATFFLDNWSLFIPFFVFAVLLILWVKKGRDPRGSGTIIAQYSPPQNLTPSQMGTVIDGSASTRDLSAEIVFLASQGFFKIKRFDEKSLVGAKAEYTFLRKKDDDPEFIFQKQLIDGIFSGGAARERKLSALKNNFYKYSNIAKEKLYEYIVNNGIYVSNPRTTRLVWIISAFAIGIAMVAVFSNLHGVAGILSGIVTGLVVGVFGYFMPSLTLAGAQLREQILGFREYLSVAEKDRIKFHNAPEKNPQQFEKFLPYAMALGVEKEWAKQFEGIYDQRPSWYEDSGGRSFSALALADSMGSFSSTSGAIMTSAPSSAAGGGSGFSGGGSGGGFGGGGGGSW